MLKNSLLLFILLSNLLYGQDSLPHQRAEVLIMIDAETSIEKVISANSSQQLFLKHCISKKSGIYLLGFDSLLDENSVLKKINATRGVVLAQYNHYTQSRSIPDDTQFSTQYALHNTGQSGGTVDADIDAPEAWDITTGGLTKTGDSIVIAIIDDGFQLTHPELNFWKNYNEIAGNAIDDDVNGFTDDTKGWNAASHNNSIVLAQHGTHVSGIAGARGNNNMGVSGVMWNVKLMPVVGSTTLESVAVEAYTYVMECRRLYNETNGTKGAFVVATNSSFGVDLGQPANFPIWCVMYDSLGKQGILSVCATANNNWNIDVVGDIPTACSSRYMISVASTNRNDGRVTATGYGPVSIDVAAPGSAILSTYVTNTYTTLSGTSMASPHVAGVVGLMYAAACDSFMAMYKLYPDSFSLIVRDFILMNTDQKPFFDTLYSSGGRLNAHQPLIAFQSNWNCYFNGINETSIFDSGLIVTPNPSSNTFTIINTNSELLIGIAVYDITARKIWEIELDDEKFEHIEIDASRWESGLYYANVKFRNGRVGCKKMIKIGL